MEIELFLHVWLEGMPHTILPNETVLVRSASSGTVVLTEQTMGDLGAKSALCCLCSQANPPIDREGKLPLKLTFSISTKIQCQSFLSRHHVTVTGGMN